MRDGLGGKPGQTAEGHRGQGQAGFLPPGGKPAS